MLLALTELRTGQSIYLHPASISLLKPLYDDRRIPIGGKIFVINYGYWLEVNELPHEIMDIGLLRHRIEDVRRSESLRADRRRLLRQGIDQPPSLSSGYVVYG